MNKSTAFLICSAAMGQGLPSLKSTRALKPARKIKLCLICNQEHTHNNSFCSAECCKVWKAERKRG